MHALSTFLVSFYMCVLDAVTMQAQRMAPPDMLCKDKFLIQSTVVPVGTTEDDITSDMVRSYCLCKLFGTQSLSM